MRPDLVPGFDSDLFSLLANLGPFLMVARELQGYHSTGPPHPPFGFRLRKNGSYEVGEGGDLCTT